MSYSEFDGEVQDAVGWPLGVEWGVWCDQPTVFAACLTNLPRTETDCNPKVRIISIFSLKLSSVSLLCGKSG